MQTLDKTSFKNKVFDFEANRSWKFAGQRPAIVDFYADWCGPCRALAPVLEEIAQHYAGQIDIYKVNTETDPELAALFGVRGIPAILFVPQQGQPTMTSGYMPADSFHQAIGQLFKIKSAK